MAKALWEEFSYEQLKQFYEEAESISDFARKLGYAKQMKPQTQESLQEKYPDLDLQKLNANTNQRDKIVGRNLIGRQFNDWLVIDYDYTFSKEKKRKCWICKCTNCGKVSTVYQSNLVRGLSKNCGCKRKENRREDLTGKQFGYLQPLTYNKEASEKAGRPCWDCKCMLCGSIKPYRALHLKSGHTQSCGCTNLSHGEEKIKSLLSELNINFVPQKTFKDLLGKTNPLRFDFYLTDLNLCIEFQGEQHYQGNSDWGGEDALKERQLYDQKKREYCEEHGIKLIEIPYWDYDKLDEEYLCNLINS